MNNLKIKRTKSDKTLAILEPLLFWGAFFLFAGAVYAAVQGLYG